MSELTATRVREHAERLHLPHLGENLDALVARAEQATMGYLEFVDLVLEEEVGAREGRRFANALKLSGLPHDTSLDSFDFPFQPDLDARKVRDLVARRDERDSILLTSNNAFSEWGQVFGDDVFASAILDRRLHHCEVGP